MTTTHEGLQLRPTRYDGLAYTQLDRSLWRVVSLHDVADGGRPALVGPQYRTKTELLADLDRYAHDSWGY